MALVCEEILSFHELDALLRRTATEQLHEAEEELAAIARQDARLELVSETVLHLTTHGLDMSGRVPSDDGGILSSALWQSLVLFVRRSGLPERSHHMTLVSVLQGALEDPTLAAYAREEMRLTLAMSEAWLAKQDQPFGDNARALANYFRYAEERKQAPAVRALLADKLREARAYAPGDPASDPAWYAVVRTCWRCGLPEPERMARLRQVCAEALAHPTLSTGTRQEAEFLERAALDFFVQATQPRTQVPPDVPLQDPT